MSLVKTLVRLWGNANKQSLDQSIDKVNELEINGANHQTQINDLDARADVIENTLTTKADLVGGKVPASQLPSYVDDVLDSYVRDGAPVFGSDWLSLTGVGGAALVPEVSKIYIIIGSTNPQYLNKTYRWSGSTYVEISASPSSTDFLPEGSTNKYFTEPRVLATVLTGLDLTINAAIIAADSILSAFGKLQKQITDLIATVSGKIPTALGAYADVTGLRVFATDYTPNTTRSTFVIVSLRGDVADAQNSNINILVDGAIIGNVRNFINVAALGAPVQCQVDWCITFIVPPNKTYRLDNSGAGTETIERVMELTL